LNITDRCVSGLFTYYSKELGAINNVNATVCPCFTEFCNAGNITLGGTAATATPPTLTTQTNSVGGATPTTTGSSTKSNQFITSQFQYCSPLSRRTLWLLARKERDYLLFQRSKMHYTQLYIMQTGA